MRTHKPLFAACTVLTVVGIVYVSFNSSMEPAPTASTERGTKSSRQAFVDFSPDTQQSPPSQREAIQRTEQKGHPSFSPGLQELATMDEAAFAKRFPNPEVAAKIRWHLTELKKAAVTRERAHARMPAPGGLLSTTNLATMITKDVASYGCSRGLSEEQIQAASLAFANQMTRAAEVLPLKYSDGRPTNIDAGKNLQDSTREAIVAIVGEDEADGLIQYQKTVIYRKTTLAALEAECSMIGSPLSGETIEKVATILYDSNFITPEIGTPPINQELAAALTSRDTEVVKRVGKVLDPKQQELFASIIASRWPVTSE